MKRGDLDQDSNFFTSGGHSLLAAKLTEEIKNNTGLRLTDVFDLPTPER